MNKNNLESILLKIKQNIAYEKDTTILKKAFITNSEISSKPAEIILKKLSDNDFYNWSNLYKNSSVFSKSEARELQSYSGDIIDNYLGNEYDEELARMLTICSSLSEHTSNVATSLFINSFTRVDFFNKNRMRKHLRKILVNLEEVISNEENLKNVDFDNFKYFFTKTGDIGKKHLNKKSFPTYIFWIDSITKLLTTNSKLSAYVLNHFDNIARYLDENNLSENADVFVGLMNALGSNYKHNEDIKELFDISKEVILNYQKNGIIDDLKQAIDVFTRENEKDIFSKLTSLQAIKDNGIEISKYLPLFSELKQISLETKWDAIKDFVNSDEPLESKLEILFEMGTLETPEKLPKDLEAYRKHRKEKIKSEIKNAFVIFQEKKVLGLFHKKGHHYSSNELNMLYKVKDVDAKALTALFTLNVKKESEAEEIFYQEDNFVIKKPGYKLEDLKYLFHAEILKCCTFLPDSDVAIRNRVDPYTVMLYLESDKSKSIFEFPSAVAIGFIGQEKSLGDILVIDGVEGGGRLPKKWKNLFFNANLNYARTNKCSHVFYNAYPGNETPKRFVEFIKNNYQKTTLAISKKGGFEEIKKNGWDENYFDCFNGMTRIPSEKIKGYLIKVKD